MGKRGPQPQLSDERAYRIIHEALLEEPTTRQRDLVLKLEKEGAAVNTAYRQVRRYFAEGLGSVHAPIAEQIRVQDTAALEAQVASGEAHPSVARLYAEIGGILETQTDTVDEEARMAAAAKAIAALRSKENEDG